MQIDRYCKKIKEAAIKKECWTCDCLQGFITQLLIDLDKEDVSELKKLLKDKQFLHSCLGCDPCPPGVLFSKYLRKKRDIKGVKDLKELEKTIHGMELKPLPFMLCVTNLILHDIEVPNVDYTDSLNREYTAIGQKDRVDVILTNPPFGASVTDGVETNFPQNFRTTESAGLFLILMVRYLKDGGRAGIV